MRFLSLWFFTGIKENVSILSYLVWRLVVLMDEGDFILL